MIAYIPFLAALAASVSAAPTIGRRSCASGYTSGSTTTSVTFAVPMTTLGMSASASKFSDAH